MSKEIIEDGKYKVTYHLSNDEGEAYTGTAIVSFARRVDDYGNGYHMGIDSKDEAFGFSSYDIRYDTGFDRNQKITYIARFYDSRYTGNNGSWKLLGIRIWEYEEV